MGGPIAVIGVDVGTSRCKAVLLAANGRVLGTASAGYPTYRGLDGEVSQDPADWLRAVDLTMRALVRSAPRVSVAAIGLTAPAHVGVLTDQQGDAIGRSLLAFDARPAAVAAELRDRYGNDVSDRTFVRLTAGWNLAQLAWLQRTTPDAIRLARWFLTQKDWIRYRLTGSIAIDPTDAAGTAMFDPQRGHWIESVCADVGLTAERLPAVRPADSVGGELTRWWAQRTRLPTGTPVAVGATDTASELVSLGATRPGDSLVKVASTGTVVVISARPTADPRVLTYPHAVDGAWYTLTATNAAATAYDWLREGIIAQPGAPAPGLDARLMRAVERLPAGSAGLLFLPFLQGERSPYWDPDLRAAFLGLSFAHRREHLCRAVLEGVAYSLRAGRDVLRELGLRVDRPQLAGGGMSNPTWRRIVLAVLGVTGRTTRPGGPAVGAAVLAARAVNLPFTFARGSGRRTWSSRADPALVARYDQLYPAYCEAADLATDLSRHLAVIGRADGGGVVAADSRRPDRSSDGRLRPR